MTQPLFVGVDGGGTKSIVRIENDAGLVLGRHVGGPASIRLSVGQTWLTILNAVASILQEAGLSQEDKAYSLHAGMGLAGSEINSAYQAFINTPHPFKSLKVTSDAHIACLGAHGGKDGAIIIAGTGVVGFQLEDGQTARVSGWGFPHDDEGGGAWLGLEAVKHTLQWLDGRAAASGLANAVYERFAHQQNELVAWANLANSTAFAELAPLVIEQQQLGDATANQLMTRAALAIDQVGTALIAAQKDRTRVLPCALLGGVAAFIEPYLSTALTSRLHPCEASPDVGAVLFARQSMTQTTSLS